MPHISHRMLPCPPLLKRLLLIPPLRNCSPCPLCYTDSCLCPHLSHRLPPCSHVSYPHSPPFLTDCSPFPPLLHRLLSIVSPVTDYSTKSSPHRLLFIYVCSPHRLLSMNKDCFLCPHFQLPSSSSVLIGWGNREDSAAPIKQPHSSLYESAESFISARSITRIHRASWQNEIRPTNK